MLRLCKLRMGKGEFYLLTFRLLRAVGHGRLHWDDSELLWETLRELAVFLVVHNGLGVCGAHILFRYSWQTSNIRNNNLKEWKWWSVFVVFAGIFYMCAYRMHEPRGPMSRWFIWSLLSSSIRFECEPSRHPCSLHFRSLF